MTAIPAALGPPVQQLNAGIPSVPELATRQKIHETARTFEQTFLSQVLGSMFQGVMDNSAFGGGDGEKAFRSFLNDAMARQMVSHGGIGLARPVELEMLRLQGLAPPDNAAGQLPAASQAGAIARQRTAAYARSRT
jgi:Rod binding domain-containing protein